MFVKGFLIRFGMFFLVSALASAGSAQSITSKKKPDKRPAAKTSKTSPRASRPAKVKAKPTPAPVPTPTPIDAAAEKVSFDAAIAADTPAEKAERLVKFLADFPRSENAVRAGESLAGARAAIANEKLTAGNTDEGLKLFRLAVEESPKPFSNRFFSEIIALIPANLYYRGQQQAALDIAHEIEMSVGSNAEQLLTLGNFFLATENGTEAKRIAESVLKIDEKNVAAYQMIGMSERLNFDLEAAEKTYAKALEISPRSLTAMRSLAEMKRAIGKPEEAIALYRNVLAEDAADNVAKTGLILALFDAGKTEEAETSMQKALEEVPGNVFLMAGAAYWYAANKNGDKAVELARKAIEKDPRFIWSYIALGRGLMLQKKPVEAERILVSARKYGNFPTLQYEIASARLAAGFFAEAAEELKKSFDVEDQEVVTRLGGRISIRDLSFTNAIALERRASIFTPAAADSTENAERLKVLFQLEKVLAEDRPDPANVSALADEFCRGSDPMSTHRKLFAASLLLDKKVAPEKALELGQSAMEGVETSLNVADPGAAVMASELYEARAVSFARNDFLLIPDVPRQTLSALMRGRIEEVTGLALLEKNDPAAAEIRFRRALTVYPKDSAWWRSAKWHLGEAMQASGNDADALENYISSYKIDKPDAGRYLRIQLLYKKVNGSLDGLEEKVGPNPIGKIEAAADQKEDKSAPANLTTTSETRAESAKIESTAPEAGEIKPKSELVIAKEPGLLDTKPADGESSAAASMLAASQAEKPAEEVKKDPTAGTNTGKEAAAVREAKTDPRPIFDPILIEIGKNIQKQAADVSETLPSPKPDSGEEKIVDVKPKSEGSAAAAATDVKPSEPEAVPEGTLPMDKAIAAGVSRPRVVEGKETVEELPTPCSISVSQDNVSILNNGGSLALIVAVEGRPVLLNAISSSPGDVEVRLEPGIISIPGRSLFVVRSISEKTGIFEVSFAAPCGKKKILISVR